MKEKSNETVNISFHPGSVVRIMFIFLIAYLLFVVRDLLLVILASVIVASAIEPITKWLMKKRIPRSMAVILIYISAISTVAFLAASFLPVIATDIREIVTTVPQYIESVSSEDINQFPGLSFVVYQFNK